MASVLGGSCWLRTKRQRLPRLPEGVRIWCRLTQHRFSPRSLFTAHRFLDEPPERAHGLCYLLRAISISTGIATRRYVHLSQSRVSEHDKL
jgi:hypothetical protein